MKKLYLLSAVAFMFAMSANAQDDKSCGFKTEGGNSSIEFIEENGATVIKVTTTDGDENQWKGQIVPPCWKGLPGQAEAKDNPFTAFRLEFDAKASVDGYFRIAPGKYASYQGDEKENTQIIKANGSGVTYDADVNIAAADGWTHFDYFDYFIGEKGADSIWLEIDCGTVHGDFYMKNIQVFINDEVAIEYFMDGGPQDAISEEASVNAYVAGDVLFAAEASDVVVYNVNGVAVLSAKNAKSVDFSSLKAGLYIAKVGSDVIKFVK